MSNILIKIARLAASLFGSRQIPLDPDTLELREWADLPSYHAVSGKAPC